MNHKPAVKVYRDLKLPCAELIFKIYPEIGEKLYWSVHVYRTQKDLNTILRNHLPCSGDGRCRDVWAYTHRCLMVPKHCLGVMYFSLHDSSDPTIVHEASHAVFDWTRIIGLIPENVLAWGHKDHERVAEAISNMVAQYWKAFCAAGFERKQCRGFKSGRA